LNTFIYTLFSSSTLLILDSGMSNVINSSKMNNLKTIQEFSRTLEDISSLNIFIQGQQDVFQGSRTTNFDSKFNHNSWRSRTSGNLTSCIRPEVRLPL